jgi:5'(3')-deoxyribonucleotidase
MNKQRIAIDFDGVIHKYSQGWKDGSIYDDVVDGAIEAIAKLSVKFDVYIFTTRAREELNQVEAIKNWLAEKASDKGYDPNWFYKLKVTDKKIPAIAYIDDRGIRFTNWNDIKKYFL